MREFVTASREGEREPDENDVVFMHDGTEVTFRKPSTSQLAIMATMRSQMKRGDGMLTLEQLGLFMQLFLGMMTKDTRNYFEPRLMDSDDPISEIDAEGGIQEIFEHLITEWSGKDTKQPAGSRASRRATGTRSTASSAGKGSTSSSSRSRVSSQ